MDWHVVYVPRSTCTVLSPDNYLHSFPATHKAVVEMTKSKWGTILFKDDCDTTIEKGTLRRTFNAEWFMSNEVLVATQLTYHLQSPSAYRTHSCKFFDFRHGSQLTSHCRGTRRTRLPR